MPLGHSPPGQNAAPLEAPPAPPPARAMADDSKPDANVLVAVRMRPLNAREKQLGDDVVVRLPKDTPGKVEMLRSSAQDADPHDYRSFKFDFSYDQDCRQEDVFNDVGKPILDKAFDGFNGTIFAYGQTGSGKTWSMTGDADDPVNRGIIPRICSALFERVRRESADGKKKFMVICSYFEIYNEMLRDLLDPARGVVKRGPGPSKIAQLQIKESKALGVYVKGLHEVVVEDENKVLQLMMQGNSMRTSGETKMNARSSRSHSIFTMKIHQKDAEDETRSVFARLNLVDLAGSERASKTEATGSRLKEGANINKSLMALGNVINALAEKANAGEGRKKKRVFIPYRNSKLTRVLQESLGGNSLCSMLATMSPARSNLEETLSTIQYANRAKMIQVSATKNEEMSQIDSLYDEIAALKKKLAAAAAGGGAGGGSISTLSKAEQKKITEQYEKQIRDINSMLSQTWDDKATLSKQHEAERTRLAEQRKKEQAALKRKYQLERRKRWKLLEEKGDIEGILKELVAHEQQEENDGGGGGGGGDDTGSPRGDAKIGGLSVAEIDAWCRDFRIARTAETAMTDQRMVLQVYRDSFETDMKAMSGEDGKGGGLKHAMSFRVGGGVAGGSPDKATAEGASPAAPANGPLSPTSQRLLGGAGAGLPPHRMKIILEQAHGKLNTLKSEGAVWISHGEQCFAACKQLATRIATKLGPPPGEAPSGSEVVGAGPGGEQKVSAVASPSPSQDSTPSTTPPGVGADAARHNTIADAPIGPLEDETRRTREALSPFVKGPKPPLSLKLLSRPPYRYMHDLITAVCRRTGIFEGLFTDEERTSAKSTPRQTKISFLQKLIACTGLIVGRSLNSFADPEQIVAGLECAKTNRLLQCVAEAAAVCQRGGDAARSKQFSLTASTRTLSGESPSSEARAELLALLPGEEPPAAGPATSAATPSSPGNNNQLEEAQSDAGQSMAAPAVLSEEEKAGLELVLRLLRSKYLSDSARLESRRDRQALFSCGAAAAKLARVLRLEARRCIDETLHMKDKKPTDTAATAVTEDGDGGKEADDVQKDIEQTRKLEEMAQELETHASMVEPQEPSAPSNRSPEQNARALSVSPRERPLVCLDGH